MSAAPPTVPIYAREERIAELFGIPVATLRTRRHRQPADPPFRKVGRRVLYRVDEVQTWIEREHAQAAGAR